jgi:hypothetical protein
VDERSYAKSGLFPAVLGTVVGDQSEIPVRVVTAYFLKYSVNGERSKVPVGGRSSSAGHM